MERFMFVADYHLGYERRGGHKVPLHDPRAWAAILAFAEDFKPHHIICGGDMVDCGAISHHNQGKPGRTEGFKLLADMEEAKAEVIKPLEAIARSSLTYIVGNHEDWLQDLIDDDPALEGIVDLRKLLSLGNRWKLIPQGEAHNLGKLTFIHGDQLSGGEQVAKNAVIAYERNIRFGHHHTAQIFTKTSPLDYKLAKTGIAVPCICTKGPKYGEGKPNKWAQGFLWGYIDDKLFTDYLSIIVDGMFIAHGKLYKG